MKKSVIIRISVTGQLDKCEYPLEMGNWVELRAKRDEHLRGSRLVWESARTAISDCCESFRANFSGFAQVVNTPQNGNRILITVRFTYFPNYPRQISVEFTENQNKISVTVDGGSAKTFEIDADEKHAFISYQNREIDANEFTKIALEKPLFEPPKPPSRTSSPSHTQWS